MKLFESIAEELFEVAEQTVEGDGQEKMKFVCEQIANLDNATPLVIIPDFIEEFVLEKSLQKIFEVWKEKRNSN